MDKLNSQLVCRSWKEIINIVRFVNDIQFVLKSCRVEPTDDVIQLLSRSPIAYRNLFIGRAVEFPTLTLEEAAQISDFWFKFGRDIKRLIFQYSDRLTIQDIVGVLKNIPQIEELEVQTNCHPEENYGIFWAYRRWRKEIFAKKVYALQEDGISKIRRIKFHVIYWTNCPVLLLN